jgi:serine/threonine protein kinase/tetratricopeptide (TPR) repeat protein
MTPEDWQRVKPILAAALELDSASRASFLKEACADPSLRQEIQSLIVANEQANTHALNSAALPSFPESASRARLELTNGTRLGDFQILSLLGAGGMGEVYGARDLRLERDVAIKVLPRFVSFDPGRLRRFEQEAKAAAALNHPNILAVFQMGTYEGAPYLVTELLEGETLREQVKRGPIPPKKAIDYGVQIAHGMAAAHEKGIVHRDLKPENLFVTRNNRIKILDFGLAKLMHPESETQLTQQSLDTEPGAVLGTVGYMSPEQVRGLAADQRVDIFALGAVLYEMLTGQRAFHKPTSAETMSAILNEDPPPVSQSTPSVPPALERAVHRCLEKNAEQRFRSASDLAFALEVAADTGSGTKQAIASAMSRTAWKWIVGAGVAVAVLLGALLWHPWLARGLTEKDTIALTDFINHTGDPVFDDALKQALSVDLEQSPFLNILSDRKVSETLRLMGRPANEHITMDVGRELCLRTGSKALLGGAISSLGSHYLVDLNAVACSTGDSLAKEQAEATSKEDVLKALSRASSSLRAKLGESLPSVQKFDVPVEVTTSSLEALKTYNMGMRIWREKGELPAAIPFLKQATEIDTNFAMAYESLAVAHGNLGQGSLAVEYATKAYELRDRVSEREKLRISGNYFIEMGQLEKATQSYEMWIADYPRDWIPHNRLSEVYSGIGRYEKALAEDQEVSQLAPDLPGTDANLAFDYMALNRLDEAKATVNQAFARRPEDEGLRRALYFLAFLQGDTVQMERQIAWAAGKPEDEGDFLSLQSATENYYGHVNRARDFSRRALDSTLRTGSKEVAASLQVSIALQEAELGNVAFARQGVESALALSRGRDVKMAAALVMARIGDTPRAKVLTEELEKDYPLDIRLKLYWLPTINASIELSRGNSSKTLNYLEAASPYELGTFVRRMYPVYVRGQAYLLAHNGPAAARELRKLLEHRGIVRNFVTGSLAHLQLGRAYVISGDTVSAKAAYQDFLTLWRDADPDVPILKQAQSEYAKLR